MSLESEPRDTVRRIISVQASGERVYLLVTIYDQADAMLSAGQVYRSRVGRGSRPEMILSASDSLTALWVSPAGHVWVGSATGHVWTTSAAKFPEPPPSAEVPILAPAEEVRWVSTTLPKLRREGYPPNISCLYGFADDDIFAGTFEGALYHWDGRQWGEMSFENRSGIGKMHALSRNELYAVGSDALVLKYDGSKWHRVRVPEIVPPWTTMSGIRVVRPGEVVVCDIDGGVYRGDSEGLEIITRTEQKWYGVAVHERRVVLVAAPGGAWELVDDELVPFRNTFAALDVFEAAPALFFIEAEQARPSVIEFNPTLQPSWGRRSF